MKKFMKPGPTYVEGAGGAAAAKPHANGTAKAPAPSAGSADVLQTITTVTSADGALYKALQTMQTKLTKLAAADNMRALSKPDRVEDVRAQIVEARRALGAFDDLVANLDRRMGAVDRDLARAASGADSDDDDPATMRNSERQRERIRRLFDDVKGVMESEWQDAEVDEDDLKRVLGALDSVWKSLADMLTGVHVRHIDDRYTWVFSARSLCCWMGKARVYAEGDITITYSRIYDDLAISLDLRPTGKVTIHGSLKQGQAEPTADEVLRHTADALAKTVQTDMKKLLDVATARGIKKFVAALGKYLFGDPDDDDAAKAAMPMEKILNKTGYRAWTVVPIMLIAWAGTSSSVGLDADEGRFFLDQLLHTAMTEKHTGAGLIGSIDTDGADTAKAQAHKKSKKRLGKAQNSKTGKLVDDTADASDDDDDSGPDEADQATKDFIVNDDEEDDEVEEVKSPPPAKQKSPRKQPSPKKRKPTVPAAAATAEKRQKTEEKKAPAKPRLKMVGTPSPSTSPNKRKPVVPARAAPVEDDDASMADDAPPPSSPAPSTTGADTPVTPVPTGRDSVPPAADA